MDAGRMPQDIHSLRQRIFDDEQRGLGKARLDEQSLRFLFPIRQPEIGRHAKSHIQHRLKNFGAAIDHGAENRLDR